MCINVNNKVYNRFIPSYTHPSRFQEIVDKQTQSVLETPAKSLQLLPQIIHPVIAPPAQLLLMEG